MGGKVWHNRNKQSIYTQGAPAYTLSYMQEGGVRLTTRNGNFRDVVAAVKPTPVVVLSRFAEWDHYIAALRDGAFDYTHARQIRAKRNVSCGQP